MLKVHFLGLYQKHDCLWNHKLETYKNKDARENALQNIVKEMEMNDFTTTEIKNKIKTFKLRGVLLA